MTHISHTQSIAAMAAISVRAHSRQSGVKQRMAARQMRNIKAARLIKPSRSIFLPEIKPINATTIQLLVMGGTII